MTKSGDAIDFAKYAIQTTIDTMKFQQRGKTVGGPIDILIIKPDNAFCKHPIKYTNNNGRIL